MVKTQQWKGLHIREVTGGGRGIVTTRIFKAGEVICDYHGPVVSKKDSEEIHQRKGEWVYLLFQEQQRTVNVH